MRPWHPALHAVKKHKGTLTMFRVVLDAGATPYRPKQAIKKSEVGRCRLNNLG